MRTENLKRYRYLVISAILGIFSFLFIYGLEPLRYSGIGWTQLGFDGNDITQHQTGWMFYRNSPWTFPLCKALYLGYPEGVSISYTDSIPLVALFFKIISPLLPETFQYFGLYTCFCFALQRLFSAALIYRFTKDEKYSVIGSLFFVFASCFLERCFRHTALSSHWLLLTALYLYFCENKKYIYWKWAVLLNCAIGIHPYLFIMSFGVFAVFTLEELIKQNNKKETLLKFALVTISIITFGFILGLFGSDVSSAEGFGIYSLNLNALFNPTSRYHEKWSSFLQERPIYAGQGDGMYYLGLPMLILFVFSVFVSICKFGSQIKDFCKEHLLFIFLVVFYILFALSDIITFDDQVVFRYYPPLWILDKLNIFRASARFFFVPYYCIMLFSVIVFFKTIKDKSIASLLLSWIIFFQIIEILPGISDFKQYFSERKETIYLSNDWDELAEKYDTAISFDCLTDRFLAFWFADKGIKTNMMISAPIHMDSYWKKTKEYREELKENLADGTAILDKNTMYVIGEDTGYNLTFDNAEELEAYLDNVRNAYKGKAELLRLTNWHKYYWILCPL